MKDDEVRTALTDFIAREFLDGEDIGLDAHTPLLEYGLIDSISLVSLTEFAKQRFGVAIPAEQQIPQNLKDIQSISAMILDLANNSANET
ncbi:MAG: acyl carrier protein [Myxococcota bacterium]